MEDKKEQEFICMALSQLSLSIGKGLFNREWSPLHVWVCHMPSGGHP